MLEKINFSFPIFNRTSVYDDEELSALELAGRTTQKVNEVVEEVNTFQTQINGLESSSSITNNRKLSTTGNFTGTLNSVSLSKLFGDISNALTLSNTLIEMVNNRESVGTIYDGGNFIDTVPPTYTIEGGTF